MPCLKNFSGYDRDTKQFLNSALSDQHSSHAKANSSSSISLMQAQQMLSLQKKIKANSIDEFI
ncbi:hypothetical protein H6G96_31015 [Nostoc sp. FACHB-892]|uniref:hypothetical protein n=1 Tax=Nostoc sp. FACHB-892 TaxID=2692843 RepID=UPI001688736F|nr:hypothetical protein [Nostoc sp. FACHB-892]MBD2730630.1 hypothetical protein [Nostoc sp. FACHB-892]